MEQTEKQLWQLFNSIDRDHNGQLDKGELRSAFVTAGIMLPASKLDQFFSEVDANRDGVITFDEWRYDLLIFKSIAQILNIYLGISCYSFPQTVPTFEPWSLTIIPPYPLMLRGMCTYPTML